MFPWQRIIESFGQTHCGAGTLFPLVSIQSTSPGGNPRATPKCPLREPDRGCHILRPEPQSPARRCDSRRRVPRPCLQFRSASSSCHLPCSRALDRSLLFVRSPGLRALDGFLAGSLFVLRNWCVSFYFDSAIFLEADGANTVARAHAALLQER